LSSLFRAYKGSTAIASRVVADELFEVTIKPSSFFPQAKPYRLHARLGYRNVLLLEHWTSRSDHRLAFGFDEIHLQPLEFKNHIATDVERAATASLPRMKKRGQPSGSTPTGRDLISHSPSAFSDSLPSADLPPSGILLRRSPLNPASAHRSPNNWPILETSRTSSTFRRPPKPAKRFE
jgi:hypothetical protein